MLGNDNCRVLAGRDVGIDDRDHSLNLKTTDSRAICANTIIARMGLLAILLVLSMANVSAADYYRFGVLPLQSPTKLADMFLPLSEALGEALGRPVQFVTAPGFAQYMDRVEQRQYDLIYLNPLLYTQARTAGYRAVAKVAQEPFTGILVVRKDDPLQRLEPGKIRAGMRIGFPDPNAFAATVMTRQYMQDLGIAVDEHFDVYYFGSQDSALMALHSGLVDVIGTWRPSLRSMSRDVRHDLRVIAETPPQPQMPIAVRSDMPQEDVRRIVTALVNLVNTDQGRQVLKSLGFEDGFVRADDNEYLGVGQ